MERVLPWVAVVPARRARFHLGRLPGLVIKRFIHCLSRLPSMRDCSGVLWWPPRRGRRLPIPQRHAGRLRHRCWLPLPLSTRSARPAYILDVRVRERLNLLRRWSFFALLGKVQILWLPQTHIDIHQH